MAIVEDVWMFLDVDATLQRHSGGHRSNCQQEVSIVLDGHRGRSGVDDQVSAHEPGGEVSQS